jgi:hypothetical protein
MLALGYQLGISGKSRTGIVILLAVIFAVVMFLISALDKPERGLIRLDQKPLIVLHRQIHAKQAGKGE